MPRQLPDKGRSIPDLANLAREQLLADNEPPWLFGHPSGVVRLKEGWDGITELEAVGLNELHAELQACIEWVRVTTRGMTPVEGPIAVTKHIRDNGQVRLERVLPQLERVIHTPLMLPDGRLVQASGYDVDSRVVVNSGLQLVVPDEPTEQEALAALALLDDVLRDFPFAGPADRANALGMLLTHPLRRMMGAHPCVPLFGVNSTVAGSGKGLLIRVMSILATGQDARSQPAAGADEDEWRKRLTSWIATGLEIIHLDNVIEPISDPSLDALLTTAMYSDRKLGSTEILHMPVFATFAASGNNLRFLQDMARRVVPILLNPGVERPELREFERDEDALLAYARTSRDRLLAAVFTLARYWKRTLGEPALTKLVIGSFQAWGSLVSNVLAAVGVTEFMANRDSVRQDDEGRLQTRSFLAAMHAVYGTEPQFARTIVGHIQGYDPDYAGLQDALPDELARHRPLDKNQMSAYLRSASSQNPYGTYWLHGRRETHTNTTEWWVEERGTPGPSGGSGGTSGTSAAQTSRSNTPSSRARAAGFSSGGSGGSGGKTLPPTVLNAQVDVTNFLACGGPETPPEPPESPDDRPMPRAHARTRVQDARGVALRPFAKRLMKCGLIGLDTETTGLYPWHGDKIRLLQIATPDEVQVIDTWAQTDTWQILRPILEGQGPVLAMHNAKFDLAMLHAQDIALPPRGKVFDTYLASLLLDNAEGQRPKQSLKALANRYLSRDLPKEMQKSDWSMDDLTDEQYEYAREDARATLDLARVLEPLIGQNKLTEAYEIELAVLSSIIGLHERGVRIDPNLWLPLAEHAQRERDKAELELEAIAGPHNWASIPQLTQIIADRGIDIPNTTETYLQDYADDPFIKALLHWREWNKGVTTYGISVIKACTEDERFHAEYNQADTRTGRMTANIVQQVPRVGGYRQAIRPIDGRCLVKCDYAQLQLVIVADLADDRSMIQAFMNGIDIHTQTASRVMNVPFDEVTKEQRQWAKALNFGLIFGAGAETLRKSAQRDYGVHWTLDEATVLREKFFFTYPGIRSWHRRDEHQSTEPLDIRVPSGRRRLGVERFTRKLNSPVQMLEVDGVKCGLALLEERLQSSKLDASIVLLVHDEIDLEASIEDAQAVAELARECLEEGMNRWLKRARAKIDVEVYRDWAGTPLEP